MSGFFLRIFSTTSLGVCIFIHMTIDELLQFVKDRPDNFSIQLKRHHRLLFDEIDHKYVFSTFGEKLYHHIYGDDAGKCEVCGQPCKFDGFHKGYRKRCSYKCMNGLKKVPAIEKTCPVCHATFHTDNRHNRVTCSAKCQALYIRLPETKEKTCAATKAAMLSKYGVEHVSQLPGNLEKTKRTKLERYGDPNYTNSELCKKTKLEKYGSETYNNSKQMKQTLVIKYGVENPSQVAGNSEKVNATKFKRFGEQMISDNALSQLKDRINRGEIGVHSKIYSDTMLKKYNTVHSMQNKAISQKMARTCMDKFYASLEDGSRLGTEVSVAFSRMEYVGTRGPNDEQIFYPFRCNTCKTEFSAIIEDGKCPTCPVCHPIVSGRSKPENEVAEFVQSIIPTMEIKRNDRTCISPLELDIYIPDKHFAIEFDGIMWHSETFGQKPRDYHINKTLACEKVGVRLMHIFEHEWLHKKDIVKRKIALALGTSYTKDAKDADQFFISDTHFPAKIFARKCDIREIDSKISSDFLNNWHIQGNDNSPIRLGAYYNNTLVAMMTFGKKRVAMGVKTRVAGSYEMYRFCVADIPVVGIASKLLSAFIKKYNPIEILTFADVRYSGTSAFYEKIGFSRISRTKPNYFYFHKSDPLTLKHRFNFRKNVLSSKLETFDGNLTEYQNMLANGFDRIWDCGHLKYLWKQPTV